MPAVRIERRKSVMPARMSGIHHNRKDNEMKKSEMKDECAGNTEYIITTRTKKNDDIPAYTDGYVSGEEVEFENKNHKVSTMSSHYTMVPGSDHSQVKEIMVNIGNKLPEGY